MNEDRVKVNEPRQVKILELFKKLQPLIVEINEWLKQDDLSYSRIVWNLEALDERRNKINADIVNLEEQIKVKMEQSEKIIKLAKEEAGKIIDSAREKNLEADNYLRKAKETLNEGIERKYKEKITA